LNRRNFAARAALFLLSSVVGLAQPENLSLQPSRPATPGNHGVAAEEFEPNLGALRRAAAELQFQLPGGQVVVLSRRGGESRSQGDVFWHGTVMFDTDSQVTLTVRRGLLAGSIRTRDGVYEIQPERGRHKVERLNLSSFAPCAQPRVPNSSTAQGADVAVESAFAAAEDQTASASAIAEIHLLSMYTPQARDAAGGVAEIEAQIQAAVDNANLAFSNSQVNARYTLVHTALANRNDTGNMSSDLSWLAGDAATATLRNQYGADMVSLIVANGGSSCGIGYVMRNPGPGFASSAFQVTDRDCAVGNLTFAHEHGHNLGLEHDPANGPAPTSASYPWSFGHFVNGSFRTVMSYSSPCANGCTRVAYFSNPSVSYLGAPTGIIDQRDNARTSNLTTPIAAAFRAPASGSPPAAPTALGATVVSSSQINLNWNDNASNETGFKIERSTDGVNFSQIATAGANATSYSNSGLAASTTYTYRVRAYNGGGDSAYSNPAAGTTSSASPPLAPSGLAASAVSSSQINLTWQDNAGNETGFKVERSTDGVNFSQIATTGANVASYSNTGLTASTIYHYRVRSYNGDGDSNYSNTANATTQAAAPAAPAAPASLTATAAYTGSGKNKTFAGVNLTWADTSSNETLFRIERCQASGKGNSVTCTFATLATVGANVTSYADPAASFSNPSGTFQYRVRSENAVGPSAWVQTQLNLR
jgi:hypothetical protein